MARRKRQLLWLDLFGPLFGLVVLLASIGAVLPPVREMLQSLADLCLTVLISLAVAIVLAFGGFYVVKEVVRNHRRQITVHSPSQGRVIDLADFSEMPAQTSGEMKKTVHQMSAPVDSDNWRPITWERESRDDMEERLRTIDWFQFEKLLALMFRKLGYSVQRLGGAKPDGGIDLIIEKGGESTAVQCKHWRTWNVGVARMREFLGALTDTGIKKGMVATLAGFTKEAHEFGEKHGIEMLDQNKLIPMLIGVDVAYDPEFIEILSDKTKYCPRCESKMVLRIAGRGQGAGEKFWGCSNYPRCKFTLPCKSALSRSGEDV